MKLYIGHRSSTFFVSWQSSFCRECLLHVGRPAFRGHRALVSPGTSHLLALRSLLRPALPSGPVLRGSEVTGPTIKSDFVVVPLNNGFIFQKEESLLSPPHPRKRLLLISVEQSSVCLGQRGKPSTPDRVSFW